jgi:hypothetical protein
MSIAHDMLTKNLIVDTVCNLLDGSATLIFKTAADIVVGVITLDADSFAVASNGEAIANGFPKTTIVTTAGHVEKFEIRTSTNVPKIFGVVSLPGNVGDIELATLDYLISDTITLTKLNYRVAN